MTQTRKRPAAKRTTARRHLHDLVDELPPGELQSARRYLQYLRDMSERAPVSLHDAPWDDEPLTAREKRAIQKGLEDLEAGRTVALEEIKRELGM